MRLRAVQVTHESGPVPVDAHAVALARQKLDPSPGFEAWLKLRERQVVQPRLLDKQRNELERHVCWQFRKMFPLCAPLGDELADVTGEKRQVRPA